MWSQPPSGADRAATQIVQGMEGELSSVLCLSHREKDNSGNVSICIFLLGFLLLLTLGKHINMPTAFAPYIWKAVFYKDAFSLTKACKQGRL